MWPLGADQKSIKLIQSNVKHIQFIANMRTNNLMRILFLFERQRKIVAEIEFPVKQVTSMVFAGPDLDTFYVTTAATNRDGEQPSLSGHLFKVTGLNAKGYPGVPVQL